MMRRWTRFCTVLSNKLEWSPWDRFHIEQRRYEGVDASGAWMGRWCLRTDSGECPWVRCVGLYVFDASAAYMRWKASPPLRNKGCQSTLCWNRVVSVKLELQVDRWSFIFSYRSSYRALTSSLHDARGTVDCTSPGFHVNRYLLVHNATMQTIAFEFVFVVTFAPDFLIVLVFDVMFYSAISNAEIWLERDIVGDAVVYDDIV